MKELLNATEFAVYSGLTPNKVYALMKKEVSEGGLKTKEVRKGLRITNKVYASELERFKKTNLFE